MAWSEANLSLGDAGMKTVTELDDERSPSVIAASIMHERSSVVSQVNIEHTSACCSNATLQKVAEIICYGFYIILKLEYTWALIAFASTFS